MSKIWWTGQELFRHESYSTITNSHLSVLNQNLSIIPSYQHEHHTYHHLSTIFATIFQEFHPLISRLLGSPASLFAMWIYFIINLEKFWMFYVQHSGHDLTIVEIDSYDEWPVFLSTTSQQQCQHDLKFNMNVTGPETNFSLFKLF